MASPVPREQQDRQDHQEHQEIQGPTDKQERQECQDHQENQDRLGQAAPRVNEASPARKGFRVSPDPRDHPPLVLSAPQASRPAT
jgi:hypothetical protein